VGSNAPSRCASGSHNSICFFSSDERRVAPEVELQANVSFGSGTDVPRTGRFTPESGHQVGLLAVVSVVIDSADGSPQATACQACPRPTA
jgi:hypothetical protein